MKVKSIIAENLKRLRRERGLTQFQLAELCSLSAQAIQNFERESREPTEATRLKICNGLGIDEIELFKFEDNKSSIEEKRISNLISELNSKIDSIPPDILDMLGEVNPIAWNMIRPVLKANIKHKDALPSTTPKKKKA